MAPDVRLGADALARRDGPLEEALEDRARRPGLACEAQRLPHLPEHFALAERHRVEPGGDAEEVPGRVRPDAVEARARELARIEPAPLSDVPGERVADAVLPRQAVDLAPVARRDDDPLGHEAAPHDPRERLPDLVRRERDALAHLLRGGAEVPAEHQEARAFGRHRKECACEKYRLTNV